MTGSAHDAAAFEHTGAAKHPDWLFEGDEFAWADSAYTVNSRTIPIHRQPASFDPKNALFNKVWSSYSLRTLCESTQGMIPMSSWPSSDYQQQLEPCRCWSVDHCCNHTAKSYH